MGLDMQREENADFHGHTGHGRLPHRVVEHSVEQHSWFPSSPRQHDSKWPHSCFPVIQECSVWGAHLYCKLYYFI